MARDEHKAGDGGATEHLATSRVLSVPAPCLELRVVAGPDAGALAQVTSERVSVGTHASNGLKLTDRAVSRFHVEVGLTPTGVLVKDLESTNGTFAGAIRIREAFIAPGMTIRVGVSTLELIDPKRSIDLPLSPDIRLGGLVGSSLVMRHLFASITRIAPHDIPVLILGETGTGKEVVARELHAQSRRKDGPFVVVDCGAIPSELAESELLGHVKGSFTGALAARRGAFEEANGGTLFLDEIGDLDIDLQPRLLRAIEAKQVKPVGSDTYRSTNVRVVAATHRDLRVAVNEGTFREDLYYRLAVATLSVPALRDRQGDIPLLVHHFAKEGAKNLGLPDPSTPIPEATLAELQSLPWRGNCRELRNHVERSLALTGDVERSSEPSDESPVPSPAFPAQPIDSPTLRAELPFKDAKATWVDAFEARYLDIRLNQCDGNVSRAAREMEIDRAYLLRLLRKHKIR